MSSGGESLIEFPADIAVKAMGLNSAEFEQLVRDLVLPLVADCRPSVTTLSSREGKYLSVRVRFQARDLQHLESVYMVLREEPAVLYTL